MTTAAWIFGAVAVVAMAFDWWAVRTTREPIETVAKPMVMVGLIGIAVLADIVPSSAQPWVIAALVLGLVGDVCLLPQIDRFIAGLAAFLVGHACYLVAFAIMWSPSWLIALGIAGLIALLGAFGVDIARSLRDSPMLVPVMAYIGVTAAIILLGAGTGRWIVAAGALAFALSDGLLGSDRFVRPVPDRRVWVHVLYHLGQATIVVGVIAA